jgi:pimeloyl-ACP methyl ester carboxylesterase
MLAHALDSVLCAVPRERRDGWPADTRLIAVGAQHLRVRDTGGRGPVVVMVPDGPNVIEHHDPVVDALAPHARVVCFDLPGFGHSRPAPGYRHSLDDGAAVVLGLMDALDIKQATLAFSCGNGFYAIAAARQAPARVRQLILCQTPSLAAMTAWTARVVPWPVRTPLVGQVLLRAARRSIAHNWYRAALPDRGLRPAFQATADRALADGGCFCLASVVQGLRGARDEMLAGVRTPTTLLWGGADRTHRFTRPESLLDLLPQARLESLPDCGHFPDLERPEHYVGRVLAALEA